MNTDLKKFYLNTLKKKFPNHSFVYLPDLVIERGTLFIDNKNSGIITSFSVDKNTNILYFLDVAEKALIEQVTDYLSKGDVNGDKL